TAGIYHVGNLESSPRRGFTARCRPRTDEIAAGIVHQLDGVLVTDRRCHATEPVIRPARLAQLRVGQADELPVQIVFAPDAAAVAPYDRLGSALLAIDIGGDSPGEVGFAHHTASAITLETRPPPSRSEEH